MVYIKYIGVSVFNLKEVIRMMKDYFARLNLIRKKRKRIQFFSDQSNYVQVDSQIMHKQQRIQMF